MKQATFFGILNFLLKNETFKIFANIFKRPISISLTTEWYQRIKSVKLNNKTTHLTKKAYNQNEPRRSSIRSTTMSRSWKVRMQGQTPLHSPQAESFLPAATRRKKRRKGKRKKEAERRRAKKNAKKRKRERETEEHEITAVAGPFVTPRTSLAKGRPGSECIPRRPRTASLQFGPRRTQVTACTLR